MAIEGAVHTTEATVDESRVPTVARDRCSRARRSSRQWGKTTVAEVLTVGLRRASKRMNYATSLGHRQLDVQFWLTGFLHDRRHVSVPHRARPRHGNRFIYTVPRPTNPQIAGWTYAERAWQAILWNNDHNSVTNPNTVLTVVFSDASTTAPDRGRPSLQRWSVEHRLGILQPTCDYRLRHDLILGTSVYMGLSK